MKKIIDGVTYNIETSTLVAQKQSDDGSKSVEQTLYQTRGGAFFLRRYEEWAVRTENGEWGERSNDKFEPMGRDQAQEWVLTAGNVEMLSDALSEPPEAEAETTPSATIYLRVPNALKQRIEAAALNENRSVNAWAMRSFEQTLEREVRNMNIEFIRNIDFVHQDGIYNNNTQAIRFFAMDGKRSIMFTVSREALEDLESARSLNEKQLIQAYDKHLDKIRDVAQKIYVAQKPDSSGAYRIVTSHFG